jgi:hypothetical protein
MRRMLPVGSRTANFPADHQPCRATEMLSGSSMSVSAAETFLKNAKQQISQRDINESLMKAIGELTGELKRLEDDLRRVRRDVQMGRRF